MRTDSVAVLSMALLCGLVGFACSSVKVASDFDPDADFSQVRSYAWLDDRSGVEGDRSDVSSLLEAGAEDCSAFLKRCADQGVLLTPGRSCGEDYARWVRLCFTSVPPTRLEAALEKLAPLFRRPT